MKTIFKSIFAAVLILTAAVSCTKQQASTVSKETGSSLTITAGVDDNLKSVMISDHKVAWTTADIIYVIDEDGTGVPFERTDKELGVSLIAKFHSDNWTGKNPVYAAHGTYVSPAFPTATGNAIHTRVVNNQIIKNNDSFAQGANGSVGEVTFDNDGYVVGEMKNIAALIGFTVTSRNQVAEINIKGNNDENVAGHIDVDYSKLVAGDADFWTPTADRAQQTVVKVTPSGASDPTAVSKVVWHGAFRYKIDDNEETPVTTFYAAVLPQTFSKGITVVVKLTNGQTVERKVASNGLTLSRNQIYTFEKPIDDGLKLQIVLGFASTSKNPFNGLVDRVNSSAAAQEEKITRPYKFTLNGYEFESLSAADAKIIAADAKDAQFCWGSSSMWSGNNEKAVLKLPLIPGYKLTKVLIEGGNGPTGTPKVSKWPITLSYYDNGIKEQLGNKMYIANADAEGTHDGSANTKYCKTAIWNLADTYSESKNYYLWVNTASTRFMQFQLTYTVVDPE